MTNFEKWEKYDVDEAEKNIEEETEIEQIKSKQAEKKAEIRSLESEGIDVAEDLAAKAAAHARVAALRAKGSSRRNRSNRVSNAESSSNNNNEPSVSVSPATSELSAQAEFLSNISTLLKSLIQQRDFAVDQLQNNNNVEAFKSFQLTLQHVADVECKLPEFNLEDDEESNINSDAAQNAVEAMRRTVHMVRVDTLRGLGQCQLAQGFAAEASESFKAALLAESEDIGSWIGRGECFLSIGMSTLAELHFTQASSIIDKPMKGKKKDSGDTDVNRDLREKVLKLRSLPVPPAISAELPTTVRECLVRCDKYCKQGSVCFKERFFRSAGLKFSNALTLLNEAHNLTFSKSTQVETQAEVNKDDLVNKSDVNFMGEAPALRDIRCSCHLNLAACFLQRARDYQMASQHCTQVLQLLSSSSTPKEESVQEFRQFRLKALLRRAEAYAKSGRFDDGINDLKEALNSSLMFGDIAQSCLIDIEKRLEKIMYKKTQFADITEAEVTA